MSNMAIQVGDRVRYRVGRGYGCGRVHNVADGMAGIITDAGQRLVNRKVSMLRKYHEQDSKDETCVIGPDGLAAPVRGAENV